MKDLAKSIVNSISILAVLLVWSSVSYGQHIRPFGHAQPMGHGTARLGPTTTQSGYRYYPRNYPAGTQMQRGAQTYPGNFNQNNFQQPQANGSPNSQYRINSGQSQVRTNTQVYSNLGVSPSVTARSQNLRVLDELGILVRTYTKNAISRLVITDVAIGGLAHRNGLRPGDMIVRANQQTVVSANDLAKAAMRSNEKIYLVIQSQSGAMRNVRIDAIIANKEIKGVQGTGETPTPQPTPRPKFSTAKPTSPTGSRSSSQPRFDPRSIQSRRTFQVR